MDNSTLKIHIDNLEDYFRDYMKLFDVKDQSSSLSQQNLRLALLKDQAERFFLVTMRKQAEVLCEIGDYTEANKLCILLLKRNPENDENLNLREKIYSARPELTRFFDCT